MEMKSGKYGRHISLDKFKTVTSDEVFSFFSGINRPLDTKCPAHHATV